MAAYPRRNNNSPSPFRPSTSRTTNRMTSSSPPPLPLFSDSSTTNASLSKTSSSAQSSKMRADANVALSKKAQLENDSMVYLDGPQVYTCGQCRTHLTSHDDIISKSFHGRKGRAYLFDQCVNILLSQPEDRFLITGLHTVCDISCKRCHTLIGWTYAKAYEPSQKYKEGKFIIEKINLHLEESDGFQVERPAGERGDKWRIRSMSWGTCEGMRGSWDDDGSGVGQYGYLGSPGGTYYGGASSPTPGVSNLGSSNQYHRSPRTPNRNSSSMRQDRFGPMSPGSPSQIIYEYRDNDD